MMAGVFCGTVIAVAIGGERTNTVVERSLASKLSADIYMVPAFSRNGDLLDFDAISDFPEVSKALLPRYGNFDGYELNGFSDITTLKSSSRVGH